MAKCRVEMTNPYTGKVWVDGVELHNVVAVRFSVDVRDRADGYAQVEIVQRVIGEIEVEGEVDVTVLDNQGARMFAAPAVEPS